MTLCVIDGGHCGCQPDEGVPCVNAKTPEQIATATKAMWQMARAEGAAAQQRQWQPIDTAPANTRIIIYFPATERSDADITFNEFDREFCKEVNDMPTHWMPLPKPPETCAAQEGRAMKKWLAWTGLICWWRTHDIRVVDSAHGKQRVRCDCCEREFGVCHADQIMLPWKKICRHYGIML